MAITDYIPNIFGQAAPSYLPGLLGAEETQNLQNRANVQGLLGAGLALAQGMSRTGPRRSAAENILGSIAGGFGAAGGAYDQGIKNYVTRQQIAQTQLAQTQAANKLKSIADAKRLYPDIASLADIDPGKFAEEVAMRQRMASFGGQKGPETPDSLRAQAQSAYTMGPQFKPLADSLIEKANRLEVEGRLRPQAPTAAPQAQTATTEAPVITGEGKVLPGMTVVGQQGPDAQLLVRKNQLLAANQNLATVVSKEARDTIKANSDEIASIDKQLDRMSVSSYDFDGLKKSVSDKFKPQVDAIKQLAETGALPAEQVRVAIQDIYRQSQESERGMRLEGLPGFYAQTMYKTADMSKLTLPQAQDVLRFANAPTAEQQASLARESQKLQFETGRGSPVPVGRSDFLNTRNVPPVDQTVQTTQVTPTATQTVPTQVVQQVQPRTQQQVTPTTAPQVSPTVTPSAQPSVSRVIDPKAAQNPLISRPDSQVPPKKKQELIQAQPGLIGATNYTIKNIVDARNAAQSLLNNPAYIDALTGMTAPAMAKVPGTDAYTANEVLNNILGRSFISEIQEMRANSPTGGAVGNVAVAEMNSLSKIRGALSLGMKKEELINQLKSYVANANRATKTIPNDYARTYGYNGEFDELLASEVVSPEPTFKQKTPVEIELERRKAKKP